MSNDLQEVDNEELQKAIDIERENGKCIVAYLDILGFKELVDKYLNSKNTSNKNILEIITTAMEDAKRPINEFLSQGEFKDIEMIKFKQFSDCICFKYQVFMAITLNLQLLECSS